MKRFDVDLLTDRFHIRSIKLEDVSERWCQWTADPLAALLLNAPRQPLDIAQLRAHVESIDQIDRIMVGIFDRATGQHVGVIAADFIDDRKRIMPSILIGEPEHRNIGVMTEIRDTFGDHAFDNLPFESAVATVLAHNEVMIKIMESRGWKFLRRLEREKKRVEGRGYIDVLVYEFPRAVWYEQKAQRKTA